MINHSNGESNYVQKNSKEVTEIHREKPTAFQAVTEMTKRLDKEGFEELKEEDHWKLKKGGNLLCDQKSFCDHSFFHSAEACVEVSYYGKPQ